MQPIWPTWVTNRTIFEICYKGTTTTSAASCKKTHQKQCSCNVIKGPFYTVVLLVQSNLVIGEQSGNSESFPVNNLTEAYLVGKILPKVHT